MRSRHIHLRYSKAKDEYFSPVKVGFVLVLLQQNLASESGRSWDHIQVCALRRDVRVWEISVSRDSTVLSLFG